MVKVFKPIRRALEHPRRQAEEAARTAFSTGKDPVDRTGDVWQWTKRKYRVRAVVLLLVNAALFAGLGCFTFWLRNGTYTPFSSPKSYWALWMQAFDPVGERQATLLDFLVYPIPVDQVPLMMVIVGLVLASLTAIPILVSMLYRFPFALIFTAIIGFVAMLPWLAVTVTICCYLARCRPLRFSFRYATALLSLLPVLAYYALATGRPSNSAHLTPVDIAKLYVPWVLAIVGACTLMAIVLLIARLVNYRPGAIAPLMAVTFAAPVILFETQVGRDELYYRILQLNYGPGSKEHFVEERDPGQMAEEVAKERADTLPEGKATPESILEQVQSELLVRLGRGQFLQDDFSAAIHVRLAIERHDAIRECRQFRAKFPRSRYVPNTYYVEGLATDMRVNPVLLGSRNMLLVRHYTDFPDAASRPVWQALCEKYEESPPASVATLRLATLEAREGNVAGAIARLEALAQRRSDRKSEQPAVPAGGWLNLLSRGPATSSLEIDLDSVVLEARKLRDLLAFNRDPQQNDLPLRRLLSMDPQYPLYRRNLQRLLKDIPRLYPLTRLGDNVRVLLACTQPSISERIQQLRELVRELAKVPDSDALVRAKYELATAYREDNLPEQAKATFEDVVRNHPDSPWATDANRHLATLNVAGRPNP